MLQSKVPWGKPLRFPKDSWQKQDAMLKRLTVEYELVGKWHRGPGVSVTGGFLFISNDPRSVSVHLVVHFRQILLGHWADSVQAHWCPKKDQNLVDGFGMFWRFNISLK